MSTPWPKAAVANSSVSVEEPQRAPKGEAEICQRLAWGEVGGALIYLGFAATKLTSALDLESSGWTFVFVLTVMGIGAILSFWHLGMLADGEKYRVILAKERFAPMQILSRGLVIACAMGILILIFGRDWFLAQFSLTPNKLDFAVGSLFAVLALQPFAQFQGLRKLRAQFLAQAH